MHQLTITADTGATTTTHHDYDDANRALLTHVKRSDTYLRTIAPPTAGRAAFELLRLSDTGTRPSVTGAAFIEPLVTTSVARNITPYYVAAAALQWIADQQATTPASPSPARSAGDTHAALSAARAALRSTVLAGSLWDEATALADLTTTPAPSLRVFDSLRHIVGLGLRPASPAALAAAVQRHADATVTPEQVTGLIWWTALLTWALRT